MTGAAGLPDALHPGDVVGTYRIEAQIGAGGSGTVYRAMREPDGVIVAFKLLRGGPRADSVARQRFDHEIRTAKAIRHRHLVPLLDDGEVDGRPFLVSRFMAGGSIADHLGEGPLSVDRAVRLLVQVASGMDALHDAGVVHRDVTAANVLIDDSDDAALGDFGLARGSRDTRLTMPGKALGTLDFIAPEVIRGTDASPASDIYSLGCVAYAMFTGAPPFAGRGPMPTAFAHLEEAPVNPASSRPGLGTAFGDVLLTAIAKRPEDRPQKASDYAEAIRLAVG